MLSILKISRGTIKNACRLSSTPILKDKSDDDSDNRKKNAKSKLESLLIQMANTPPEENPTMETSHPIKRVVDKRPSYKVDLKKIKDRHTAKLVTAVKDVADELGGPDVKTTETELLYVVLNNKRPEGKTEGSESLKDVISSMKVERGETRAEQVRRQMPADRPSRTRRETRDDRNDVSTNLFGHADLGIFPTEPTTSTETCELSIWEKMTNRELKILVTHPPNNIFEEMILWTERGKLWKFPIDNEQGLELEKNTDFTQHVFLEEHLAGWCPAKGPIRYFMDLVLVGLSKNPYITVQAKIDHIMWFKEYFESKRTLLESTGAISAIPEGDRAGVTSSST